MVQGSSEQNAQEQIVYMAIPVLFGGFPADTQAFENHDKQHKSDSLNIRSLHDFWFVSSDSKLVRWNSLRMQVIRILGVYKR